MSNVAANVTIHSSEEPSAQSKLPELTSGFLENENTADHINTRNETMAHNSPTDINGPDLIRVEIVPTS